MLSHHQGPAVRQNGSELLDTLERSKAPERRDDASMPSDANHAGSELGPAPQDSGPELPFTD
jgi:hypothetical protein